jgi:NADPH:quinone reductase-like Zn-dependent oxidoreductase
VKAIQFARFGGPEMLCLVDLPAPVCRPGGVLIDVHAASVIPGDWKLRAGHLRGLFTPALPKIPGRDGAGVVAEIGAGVTGFRPGDAVCFVAGHEEPGSYAERICRPQATVIKRPAGLSFVAAAALMHAGICAWTCLVETAHLAPGMTVLIHGGAGAIGGAAIQIACHLGARVATTCGHADLDYVRGLGADIAIAYDRDDFTTAIEDVDVVVDLVGGAVHRRSYAVLRRGATLVYLIAAPLEKPADRKGVRAIRAEIRDDRATLEAVAGLAGGAALRPQISRVLPLAAAAEAHRLLEAGAGSRGRIVLAIR